MKNSGIWDYLLKFQSVSDLNLLSIYAEKIKIFSLLLAQK